MDALLKQQYKEEGVCLVKDAVTADWLQAFHDCWQWSMDNPGPLASTLLRDGSDAHQDLCHPDATRRYGEALINSPVADIVSSLWDSPDVWFMYEQIFFKGNRAAGRTAAGRTAAGRTPWHQDLSYLAVNGDHLTVMWMTFEPVPAELSLEFVRGSHRGQLYDGSAFQPDDPTAPLYGNGELPRLPDIERQRDQYDIVSYAVEPGDVVMFHPGMLHGGGPTNSQHPERSTLTLRFFGEHAVYEPRPGPAGPFFSSWKDTLAPGQPFRHDRFLKLR